MIKNILAMRNDRFGEFLLIIPALRALKEKYPQANVTLAVDNYVVDLANAVEGVNDLIVWENRGHSFREIYAFSRRLKARQFDLVVIFNPSKESNQACALAGIPIRVGYDRKWGFLLTHKMTDNKDSGLKHEVEYNLELVNLIGAGTTDKTISLDKLPAVDNLKYTGAIALHLFTSDPVKEWPVERFMELAKRLTREMKVKIVLLGKVKKGEGLRPGIVPAGIEDLINKTTLIGLASVLKECRLLVTCDSGPMHLSAAVGTPVVALFRNDLQGKTARRWGPWGKGHTVIDKNKLEDISVDEVMEVVKDKLNSGTVP